MGFSDQRLEELSRSDRGSGSLGTKYEAERVKQSNLET